MTTADSAIPTEVDPAPATTPRPLLARLESGLLWGSELLNPILVKEARQSLKSRQFLVTFSIVLICGWGWSLAGVAMQMPAINYLPGGLLLLRGYCLILAFPLLLVVPFSAFRSLASEREDGTYELLAITTLRPTQIIAGKLGSAILQMLIYLSALAPCIAFTYMLRGVDVLLIMMLLGYTFLGSIFLSVITLLIATITQTRHWQAVLSVVVILGLVIVFLWYCAGTLELLSNGVTIPYDQQGFWMGNVFILSVGLCYMLLFFLAAAARITFESDNRSTRLRWAMMLSQLLIAAWGVYGLIISYELEFLNAMMAYAAIHWFLLGSLMTGENDRLSPRVRRSLPQSFAGRVGLTWFNPGPGAGYMFVVGNMISLTMLSLAMNAWTLDLNELPFALQSNTSLATQLSNFFDDQSGRQVLFSLNACAYVVFYLGMGRIFLWIIHWVIEVNIFAAALMQVILLTLGVLVSLLVQFSLDGLLDASEYTLLQTPNPFWTLGELTFPSYLSQDVLWSTLVLVPSAGLVLFINVLLTAPEVSQVRLIAPLRVLDDDRQRIHAKTGGEKPTSPWEEEADGGDIPPAELDAAT